MRPGTSVGPDAPMSATGAKRPYRHVMSYTGTD
jgi:hypothetical protein